MTLENTVVRLMTTVPLFFLFSPGRASLVCRSASAAAACCALRMEAPLPSKNCENKIAQFAIERLPYPAHLALGQVQSDSEHLGVRRPTLVHQLVFVFELRAQIPYPYRTPTVSPPTHPMSAREFSNLTHRRLLLLLDGTASSSNQRESHHERMIRVGESKSNEFDLIQ